MGEGGGRFVHRDGGGEDDQRERRLRRRNAFDCCRAKVAHSSGM